MRVDLVDRDGKVLGQLLLAEGITVHDVNKAAMRPSEPVAVEREEQQVEPQTKRK